MGVARIPHPGAISGIPPVILRMAKELGGYRTNNDPMRQQETTRSLPSGGEDPRLKEADEELDISTFANGFVDDLRGYARAEKRYLMLHFSERTGTLMAKGWSATVVIACAAFTLLFLNTALAWALGEVLGSMPSGFALVAGLYALALGVFMLVWRSGARERFIINRINDLLDGDDLS
ncbi:MAG: hypothetical protein IT227_06295 [Flavobacteriales bacterium]|nr:hypothetical protein [Flavobacteriales bacterium]